MQGCSGPGTQIFLTRMREAKPQPRQQFCWGPLERGLGARGHRPGELWRGHNFIEQARRDAADDLVSTRRPILVAAFRAQLAATSASWARAERGGQREKEKAAVTEAAGARQRRRPVASKIDRVVPTDVGVDAAGPTARAKAEARGRIVESTRRGASCGACAAAAEPVAKRRGRVHGGRGFCADEQAT